jgi:hypothetical protein
LSESIRGTRLGLLVKTNVTAGYLLTARHISSDNVPADIMTRPISDFSVNFSFRIRDENAMVTTMLILSIGTTTLAGPSWSAL